MTTPRVFSADRIRPPWQNCRDACGEWSTLAIAQSMTSEVMESRRQQGYPRCMRPANHTPTRPFGALLREWRQRRRLSQLNLAFDANISTRHLSCLETGRAAPSREMLLRLARRLDVALRERNVLLTAAGFAPMFVERALNDPALKAAREAVDAVLRGHEPYPALAMDRHWNMLAHNRVVPQYCSRASAPNCLRRRSTCCA